MSRPPLQNRVDPWGRLIRTPARGSLMGNRGLLHRDREIVRPFRLRAWITCVLEFKQRRRTVMSPGRYTELFFLDEATAFAAGHRPCAECRRERFNAFKDAWRRASGHRGPLPVDVIDRELHRARVPRTAWRASLSSLPAGTFVEIAGVPYVIDGLALRAWTPHGYLSVPDQSPAEVDVLTPEPIVRCFREGYRPVIL